MLNILCVSHKTRWAVECTIIDVAIKNGGADTFFTHHGGMKDYATNVKFVGHSLLVVTKVNNK